MVKTKRDSIALQQLTVEYGPIAELKPNSWNPNVQTDHEFGMLKASMRGTGGWSLLLPGITACGGYHRPDKFLDCRPGAPPVY